MKIFEFVTQKIRITSSNSSSASCAASISTLEGNSEGLAAAFSYLCRKFNVMCIMLEL